MIRIGLLLVLFFSLSFGDCCNLLTETHQAYDRKIEKLKREIDKLEDSNKNRNLEIYYLRKELNEKNILIEKLQKRR